MTIIVSEYSQAVDLVGLSPSGDVTRPDLVITLDNVPSSMLDGGATSCLNGGGDIRAASPDGTGQIPIDVRRCVVSASAPARSLEIRISPASYTSAARGITLFWGKAGATQPAADSEFGSEAVYDHAIKLPLTEEPNTTTSGYSDVSGNTSGTGVGTGLTANSELTPWGSKCTEFSGVIADRIAAPSNILNTVTSMRMSQWVKVGALGVDLAVMAYKNISTIGSTANSAAMWMDAGGAAAGYVGYTRYLGNSSVVASTDNDNAVINQWQKVTMYADNTGARALYVDGVAQPGTLTSLANVFDSAEIDTLFVGLFDSTRPLDGFAAESDVVFDRAFDENREEIEYLSQSDPTSFWAVSAAYDPNGGGGSVLVTGTSDQTSELSSDPAIDLSSQVLVTGTSDQTSELSSDPTIDLSSQVLVTGTSDQTSELSSDPTIDLSSQVLVTGTSDQTSEFSSDPAVSLTSSVNLTGQSDLSEDTASNPTVVFGSEVSVVGSSDLQADASSDPDVVLTADIQISGTSDLESGNSPNPTVFTSVPISVVGVSDPSHDLSPDPTVLVLAEVLIPGRSDPSYEVSSNPEINVTSSVVITGQSDKTLCVDGLGSMIAGYIVEVTGQSDACNDSCSDPSILIDESITVVGASDLESCKDSKNSLVIGEVLRLSTVYLTFSQDFITLKYRG